MVKIVIKRVKPKISKEKLVETKNPEISPNEFIAKPNAVYETTLICIFEISQIEGDQEISFNLEIEERGRTYFDFNGAFTKKIVKIITKETKEIREPVQIKILSSISIEAEIFIIYCFIEGRTEAKRMGIALIKN
ncbi:MAG: hypothetical protein IPO72_18915 [Saprospiraceae bacterium]|nr:hypothetical protein [Candidatus Vicinibacter affinis]MBP6172196.1 hypothetical protein [Saprospiraceae bacterium]MBK6571641.1 hypothetical protein [Candidatus Vicinibacter affinis]MBK7305373.1 hypothetical protein [Candidatus Vicinibacter affinis]MBK7799597.1 hypothetical protein [Candidatus Vicinibacter affinis]